MERNNMNDLINQVKSSNQKQVIQKIVPIEVKTTEEVQFSFYIEKKILKKLKLKAIQEDTSIKNLINKAIKNSLI